MRKGVRKTGTTRFSYRPSSCPCVAVYSATTTAQHAKNSEEEIQQVEINRDCGRDIFIRPVDVPETPRVNYQQAAEHENRYSRKPEIHRRISEVEIQKRSSNQNPQSRNKKTSPRAEIA